MVTFAQAAETATTAAYHMTFGEAVLTASTLLLALVTVALFVVSAKLVKATTMAATAEMTKVATNANDDMRDVAQAALVSPATPKPPTFAYSHPRTVITRHPISR